MATQIPLTFRLAPLPTGFVGNPQQIATAIVARLSAVSANTLSFFASGSVAPTSNIGPWLKNDQTWYVWSDTLATYVPEVIESQSLGYIFSKVAPDPLVYKVWLKLDSAGNPDGIFAYANGSWQDFYTITLADYSTTAQMNTAIATAVGNQSKYPFSAKKLSVQNITAGSGAQDLLFPTTEFDPDSVYSGVTSRFTAPVNGIYEFRAGCWVGLSTGSPTGISISFVLIVDGASQVALSTNESGSDTGGRTMVVERSIQLSAGQVVGARMSITTTGASTWDIPADADSNFFQGSLIQAV